MIGKSVIWFPVTVFLTTACPTQAQQPKVARIGYLAVSTASAHAPRVAALRQGLRERGYVEGQNIVLEFRYAEGNSDRLQELAADLVRLKVDAMVTTGTEGALAGKNATSTVPIVMATGDDPVARGVVASLAMPGGNITGVSSDAGEIAGKRLEVLKQTVPSLTRVGVLWYARDPGAAANFEETQAAARALRVQVRSLEVGRPVDFDTIFRSAIAGRVQGLAVLSSGVVNTYRRRIVEFSIKNRLPAAFAQAAFVDTGGLMFYGPNTAGQYRRVAYFIDKILKGTKPADLPIEQPTKFEFVINLKTAKQIGLIIPPNVLARTDRVIR